MEPIFENTSSMNGPTNNIDTLETTTIFVNSGLQAMFVFNVSIAALYNAESFQDF